MERKIIKKSIDELLTDAYKAQLSTYDAYKAQLSTYDALLSVKDAQVAFLEECIKGLKLELEQYKNKHHDSTGLTDKEREDIAKLSKEIMEEEPTEENEWPEEMSIEIEIDDFNNVLKGAIKRALGILDAYNTDAKSDVDPIQNQLNQLSAQISEINQRIK